MVAFGLALFSSLSVLVIYFLARDIFEKKEIALLSAFLMAVSATHVQEGAWLSNPVIMILSVPLFFWMLWKVFFLGQKKFIYWLLFFFGISNQSAIFTVFLLGPLLIAYLYKANQEKKVFIFSVRQYFLGGAIYLLTISTMILTEVLMLKRGVLTLNILNKTSEHFFKGSEVLIRISELYLNFALRALSPTNVLLFFIPLFGLVVLGFSKLNNKKRLYFLTGSFSILWLLSWHFRTSLHLFIGLNVFIYILLAVGLWQLRKLFKGKWVLGFVVISFAVLNLSSLQSARTKRIHLFGIQRGALLSEQISLIEKTYELTGDEPFSISTLTAPYGVNVTWAYLYDSYGSKYGFLPIFFGPTQAGWVGENLLEEIDGALPNHFTIIDPDVYLGEGTAEQFLLDQTSFSSTPSATYKFGTLILQQRRGKLKSN